MKIINPYNNEKIGEIQLLSEKEVVEKVENAVQAKRKMRKLSAGERAAILQQIVEGIKQEFNAFVEMISKESGKPYRYAKGEVERAIQTFTIAAEETKRLPHELFDIDATEKGRNLQGEYVYFPKGVVLGISPFNFPLNLAVHKIAPAIATGCPILLKPSSKTPLTMVLLEKIILQTNLPENGFQLIHCSREIGNQLIEHPEIDVLSFTGSPAVGWEMKSRAGKKSVVLELGGNAAAILAEDTEIEQAIEELIVGGFAYAGQVCIHTQRIYIHTYLFDEFVKKFVEKARQLAIGNPILEETEFSGMIDEKNAMRIEKWIEEAKQAGATELLGGERKGNLIPPTILTGVEKGQKVRDEEVFGPVVLLEKFDSIESAIDEVNDCRWGLQTAVFTNQIAVLNQCFENLEVGTVIHNRSTTFRVDDMPYGGIKDSGFGREGVRYAMMDFLEGKLLVKSRS